MRLAMQPCAGAAWAMVRLQARCMARHWGGDAAFLVVPGGAVGSYSMHGAIWGKGMGKGHCLHGHTVRADGLKQHTAGPKFKPAWPASVPLLT